MLGGRDHVALRGVADDDAFLGGGGDVDVVEPGAGPAHDLQLDRRVEQGFVDDGLAAHDYPVVLGDDREDLLAAELVLDVYLAGGRQSLDGFVVHELSYQHFGVFETFHPASNYHQRARARMGCLRELLG